MKSSKLVILLCAFISFEASAELLSCLDGTRDKQDKNRDIAVQKCLENFKAKNFDECEKTSNYFSSFEQAEEHLNFCFQNYSESIPSGATCKDAAARLSEVQNMYKNISDCIDKFEVDSLSECMEINSEYSLYNPASYMAKKCVAKLESKITADICTEYLNKEEFSTIDNFQKICIKKLEINDFASCKVHAQTMSSDLAHDSTLLLCLSEFKENNYKNCMEEVMTLKISTSKFGGMSICIKNRSAKGK